MRNMLLFGASALALSLTVGGAFAQQQSYANRQAGYTDNAPSYASEDAYRPRAVLGAHEVYGQSATSYPDHEDARSIGR
ncbi:MAG: hypothetical protein E7774_10165 [Bradyrhizobium sp.]|nr:MAG: hypothetical protein E7774_10165 [Bradyrhizobium sp.]